MPDDHASLEVCPVCDAPKPAFCYRCGAPYSVELQRRPSPINGTDLKTSPRKGKRGFTAAAFRPLVRTIQPNFEQMYSRIVSSADVARDFIETAVFEPTLLEPRQHQRKVEILSIITLTIVAAVIRFWDLSGAPAGLAIDESWFALDAIQIIDGARPGVYSHVAFGNPSGFSYLAALVFSIGEPTPMWLRSISAVSGIAVVPIGYMLLRLLFPFRVAILAATLATFSSWFIIQSRLGAPMMTTVSMALISIWLLVWAARSERLLLGLAGGIVFGLSLYIFRASIAFYVTTFVFAVISLFVGNGVHRKRVTGIFLVTSLVIGYPMLNFIFTTNFIPDVVRSYGTSDLSFETLVDKIKYLGRLALLVHLPTGDPGWDGTPRIPVIHDGLTKLLYWVGLGSLLLFIKRRSVQLLILGWIIGASVSVAAPGAEGRRFLIGIFVMYTFIAVGAYVFIHLVLQLYEDSIRSQAGRSVERKIAVANKYAPICIIVAFVAVFAFTNNRVYSQWLSDPDTFWRFETDFVAAIRYLENTHEDKQIRFYSYRRWINHKDHGMHHTARWLVPEINAVDGSSQHNGDGTIYSAGPVILDTIYILLDDYLPLSDDLESEFPNGELYREVNEDGDTLFIAYQVSGLRP